MAKRRIRLQPTRSFALDAWPSTPKLFFVARFFPIAVRIMPARFIRQLPTIPDNHSRRLTALIPI